MHPAPSFQRLLQAAPLLLCLWLMLSLPSLALSPDPYQPAADAWGLEGLDQAAPGLLARAGACDRPAAARFFESLGGDYILDLGNGQVPIIGRGSWMAGPVILEGRSWKPYPSESST